MSTRHFESLLGVVVIGRNEGARLKRCLESVLCHAKLVVYVDSGSTDRSVEMALDKGVVVLELDMSIPFTAARARNAGFHRLLELNPELTYVQFVDGDCEVADRWLETAADLLRDRLDVAAVCGRLRERFPEQSIYNMLCDIEWDGPLGEIKSCGGNAMMRVAAFASENGFRPDLIAGEEPELCVRLRAAGWHIWRSDQEMALHDAAMTRIGQWWMRTLRAGYSYAQAAYLHGAPPERHGVQESRSAWFWGFAYPLFCSGLVAWWGPMALPLFVAYPLQVARLALRGGRSVRENWWHATFLVAGKFPELVGQLKFLSHLHLGRRAGLIEHK